MVWTWERPTNISAGWERAVQECQHPGLLLDRFTPTKAFETGGKRDWLAHVAPPPPKDRNVKPREVLNSELLKAQRKRWEETVVQSSYGQLKPMALQTAARLIVGLGAEHALETAITLDRNSGAPIIPGSALKGVARTYALVFLAELLIEFNKPDLLPDDKIEQMLNTLDNWLSKAEIDWNGIRPYLPKELNQEQQTTLENCISTFRDVFGYVGAIGRTIFFNAVYMGTTQNPFEVDVMTPHFSSYYTTSANRPAPSDDQNPIPVPYLVVRENLTFLFAVGAKTPLDMQIAKQARSWLREGLIVYGVGAKTAQGYGVFRKPPQKG